MCLFKPFLPFPGHLPAHQTRLQEWSPGNIVTACLYSPTRDIFKTSWHHYHSVGTSTVQQAPWSLRQKWREGWSWAHSPVWQEKIWTPSTGPSSDKRQAQETIVVINMITRVVDFCWWWFLLWLSKKWVSRKLDEEQNITCSFHLSQPQHGAAWGRANKGRATSGLASSQSPAFRMRDSPPGWLAACSISWVLLCSWGWAYLLSGPRGVLRAQPMRFPTHAARADLQWSQPTAHLGHTTL